MHADTLTVQPLYHFPHHFLHVDAKRPWKHSASKLRCNVRNVVHTTPDNKKPRSPPTNSTKIVMQPRTTGPEGDIPCPQIDAPSVRSSRECQVHTHGDCHDMADRANPSEPFYTNPGQQGKLMTELLGRRTSDSDHLPFHPRRTPNRWVWWRDRLPERGCLGVYDPHLPHRTMRKALEMYHKHRLVSCPVN